MRLEKWGVLDMRRSYWTYLQVTFWEGENVQGELWRSAEGNCSVTNSVRYQGHSIHLGGRIIMLVLAQYITYVQCQCKCQQIIARENSWHLNEIGVVTSAKTCEDGQPPLLLGAPSHAVQNPPQAASSSRPVESLWRGVLETILSGFFPQMAKRMTKQEWRC